MKTIKTMSLGSLLSISLVTMTIFAGLSAHAGEGTNGGGGGGVIVCNGQRPVLTDFFEAGVRNPGLIAPNGQLTQLRKLTEAQALQYMAKQMSVYSGSEVNSKTQIDPEILGMLRNVLRAFATVKKDGDITKYDYNPGPDSPTNEMRLRSSEPNPNDSGVIFGLNRAPGCREERVAVTHIAWTREWTPEDPSDTFMTLVIRNKALIEALPPIDRIALLFNHELIQGMTQGKLDLGSFLSNHATSSEKVRELNAWMSLTPVASVERVLEPQKGAVLTCDVFKKLDIANRNADYNPGLELALSVELELGATSSRLHLTNFKETPIFMPTYADINLARANVRRKKVFDNGYNLVIPAQVRASGALKENSPRAMGVANGFSVEIVRNAEGIAEAVVRDTKSGAEKVRGTITCVDPE